MEPLVEVVPNVSEGRRGEVIERLIGAVEGIPGAWVLDATSDPDHGRSVITLAGRPGSAVAAMEAIVGHALQLIDMRTQRGAHPRVGAVDVVPFVPLGGLGLADCAAIARAFGETIAARHALPVYLYGAAARRPDRTFLAAIRRPGFEGLAEALSGPGGAPDAGPARPHPSGGATIVGARNVLIAFNVQLDSDDVGAARRIAARIRERGGGLPWIQALGLYLERERHAQVSMNVLDHVRTPLWRVWEEVERLARMEGLELLDSELVGLMPAAALDSVSEHLEGPPQGSEAAPGDGLHRSGEDRTLGAGPPELWPRRERAAGWLRLRDYGPRRLLEVRLADVMADV